MTNADSRAADDARGDEFMGGAAAVIVAQRHH
jgi:hypothetical protein